jgi:hypothetical protein
MKIGEWLALVQSEWCCALGWQGKKRRVGGSSPVKESGRLETTGPGSSSLRVVARVERLPAAWRSTGTAAPATDDGDELLHKGDDEDQTGHSQRERGMKETWLTEVETSSCARLSRSWVCCQGGGGWFDLMTTQGGMASAWRTSVLKRTTVQQCWAHDDNAGRLVRLLSSVEEDLVARQ